jgi:hypothetical protein
VKIQETRADSEDTESVHHTHDEHFQCHSHESPLNVHAIEDTEVSPQWATSAISDLTSVSKVALADSCVALGGLGEHESLTEASSLDTETGDEGGIERSSAPVSYLTEGKIGSRVASSAISAECEAALSDGGIENYGLQTEEQQAAAVIADMVIGDQCDKEQSSACVHYIGETEMGSQLGSVFTADSVVAFTDSCVERCGLRGAEKQKAAFSRDNEIGDEGGVEHMSAPVHEIGETEMVSRLASSAFSAEPAVAISVLGRDNETGDQGGVEHTSALVHELGDYDMGSQLGRSAFSAERAVAISGSCVERCGLQEEEKQKSAFSRDNEIGDQSGVEQPMAPIHELGDSEMVSRLASSAFSAESVLDLTDSCVKQSGLRDDERRKVALGRDNEISDQGGVEHTSAPVHELGETAMVSRLASSDFSAEPAVAISGSCVERCGQQEEEKQKSAFSRDKEIGDQSGVEQPMAPVHELGETEMVSRLASSAFPAESVLDLTDSCVKQSGLREEEQPKVAPGRDNEIGDQSGVEHMSAPVHEVGETAMFSRLASSAFPAESVLDLTDSCFKQSGLREEEQPKVAPGRDNEIGGQSGVEHMSAPVHEVGETAMFSRLASSAFSAQPAVAISVLGRDNETGDQRGVQHTSAPAHELGDSEMGYQLASGAFSAESAVAISGSCVERCGSKRKRNKSRLSVVTTKLVIKVVWNSQWHLYMSSETLKWFLDWRAVPSQQSRYST